MTLNSQFSAGCFAVVHDYLKDPTLSTKLLPAFANASISVIDLSAEAPSHSPALVA
jgi:hypothetical protein